MTSLTELLLDVDFEQVDDAFINDEGTIFVIPGDGDVSVYCKGHGKKVVYSAEDTEKAINDFYNVMYPPRPKKYFTRESVLQKNGMPACGLSWEEVDNMNSRMNGLIDDGSLTVFDGCNNNKEKETFTQNNLANQAKVQYTLTDPPVNPKTIGVEVRDCGYAGDFPKEFVGVGLVVAAFLILFFRGILNV